MNISLSGKGVHRREVPGIEKLRGLPPHWYAFPNLELIEQGSMPRQIDVVVVLDDRILIADIKDWHGRIASDGDRWFQNDRSVDTSPVKKILENARILKTLLSQYLAKTEGRSFNSRDVPLVEGVVILTGRCDIKGIAELEKPRVFQVDDFCRMIQDPRERNRRLAAPPWIDRTNPLTADDSKWRGRLRTFFGASGGYFKPLDKRYGDYVVVSDVTYEHPNKIYSEYDAEEATATRASGLLRLWDFSQAAARYASEEGRADIAGREQNVIAYLVDRHPDFETVLIRPKASDPDKGIHYWEVFERRRQLRRLGEFVAARRQELSPPVRLDLARTLLAHGAAMHRLGAAHLDIGEHSVWLELPSTVRLSHLVAASYPEMKSLGDRRYEFLAGTMPLPEDVLGVVLDHFRKDVFLLACAVHTLVFLEPPKPATAGDPPDWNPQVDASGECSGLHAWFKRALDHAPDQRFGDSQEMLDAFNEATSTRDSQAAAFERLQRFRKWKSLFELMRAYPVSELLVETDRVVSWRSAADGNERLVKAWRRTCWDDERLEAARLARFCESAEDYVLARPQGFVPIVDVGYLGDHVVVVQDFIRARTLAEELTSDSTWPVDAALRFALALASAVRSLHERGWSHGDLKPANILVINRDDQWEPLIVDLVDLIPASEGEVRTTAYSPRRAAGSQERDRFAVLTITAELTGWVHVSDTLGEALGSAIAVCRDQHPPLATLEPLIEAIENALRPSAPPTGGPVLVLAIGEQGGPVVADEGRYHVCVPTRGQITVTGAAEELAIRLDHDGRINSIRRRDVQQDRVALAEKRAVSEFTQPLVFERGGVNDYGALEEALRAAGIPGVKGVVSQREERAAPANEPEPFSDPTGLAEDDESDGVALPESPPSPIDVPGLWRTLMDVEQEQFTEGVADADSFFARDRRRHFVRFHGRKGTLDFAREDKVVIEIPSRTQTWVQVGVLDQDLSRSDLLAIDASAHRSADGGLLCPAGTEIRFRSLMEADSRARRNAATSRILSRKSVVPDLIDYFDSRADPSGSWADVAPTSEIARERYGLNPSQADAFVSLWSRRPVGLLQGPPGTGKTQFIAAMVHYALGTGLVRNVLLASQSHEAVNNAAEGVLRLFRHEGREPSLVRVGQQGNVSEPLKPYHSEKVESRYREQFRAGLKQRFATVGRHLTLPPEFVDAFFFLEATVWPVFSHVQALRSEAQTPDRGDDREHRLSGLIETLGRLSAEVAAGHLERHDWSNGDAYDDAINGIGHMYGVTNAEHIRRLRSVAMVSRDWMGSVSSRRRNFEEFLANTRQIVCGTCVGLGRSSLGLSATRFDLVIVDEAARCTPSELAVPVQSGRWVLLVGDHCQLEPFHEPAVVRETRVRTNLSDTEIVRSDFERAFDSSYGKRVGKTLTTQYRMLPNIGRLVSEVFYGNRLEHGRHSQRIPEACLPEILRDEVLWIKTDDLGDKAFQVKQRFGKSLNNPAEADAIVDVLLALDEHEPFAAWLDTQPDDEQALGIICTYAAQRELVRQKLHAAGVSSRLLSHCKIDTVDSYQGKENTIVIVSLVRHNVIGRSAAGDPEIAQGFMARGNRINVALSRAMDRLIIVGAAGRWPEGSPMARVSAAMTRMAEEGAARFIEPSALARGSADGEAARQRRTAGSQAHRRNVRKP